MTITSVTLTNPGAESGDTSGWTVRSGTSPFTATTNLPHSGSWRFDVVTGQNFTTFTCDYDQQITVDAGLFTAIDAGKASVDATGWGRTSGFGAAYLYVQFFDSGVSLISTVTDIAFQSTTYAQKRLLKAIPANTRYIRIGTHNYRTNNANSNTFWDDFALSLSDNREADYPGSFAPQVSQYGAYLLATFPTAQLRISQGASYLLAASQTSSGLYKIKSHQLGVYVLTRSSPRRRRMQAWTFSLDGHDFYVLELAGEGTIVYDVITGQWCEWRTEGQIIWRARIGANWLGMAKTTADRLYGTNVVCGDNAEGILWMLDPTQGYDDPTSGSTPDTFTRYVNGYVPIRMRETQPNAGVYVTLNLGAPSITGAAITLRTSDDNGNTYYSHGSNTITASDWTQEVAWRGLGLMRSPGRLFELTDNGAAVRIAAADMK